MRRGRAKLKRPVSVLDQPRFRSSYRASFFSLHLSRSNESFAVACRQFQLVTICNRLICLWLFCCSRCLQTTGVPVCYTFTDGFFDIRACTCVQAYPYKIATTKLRKILQLCKCFLIFCRNYARKMLFFAQTACFGVNNLAKSCLFPAFFPLLVLPPSLLLLSSRIHSDRTPIPLHPMLRPTP